MKHILPLLLIMTIFCSCNIIGTRNSSNEKAINNTETATVNDADANISSVIEAEKTTTSVQASDVAKLHGEIKDANRPAGVVWIIAIAIIAVVACIYLIIKIVYITQRLERVEKDTIKYDKTFEDKVVEITKELIDTQLTQQINSRTPYEASTSKISESNLEKACADLIKGRLRGYIDVIVDERLESKGYCKNFQSETRKEIATFKTASEQIQTQTDKSESETKDTDITVNSTIIEPKPKPEPEPKYQLFARDSPGTDTISGIQNSFQIGKSIYKLLLLEKEDRHAQITLCVEQESVQRRILNTDIGMLTPICIVQKKNAEPQRVIVNKPGTAELIEQDSWKVTAPINVVLE